MNNLISIIKINFRNEFGLNKFNRKNQSDGEGKKLVLGSVGIATIGLLMVAISTMYAMMLAYGFKSIGQLELVLITMIFVASMVTFVTSIYKAPGILFNFRDYELLMSLPISEKTILVSKIITLLIMNYLFVSVVVLPAAGVYWFMAENVPLIFIVYLLISILIIPLLPVIIASVIAVFINYMASKVRFSKLIGTVGIFIIFLGLMVGMMSVQNMAGEILMKSPSLAEAYLKIYPPAYYLTMSLTTGSIIDLLIFITISVIPFVIFIVVLGRVYKGIVRRLSETYRKNDYVLKELKSNSPLRALIMKELRKYFSTTIYVFNTFFGMIMVMIGGIFAIVTDPREMLQGMNVSGIDNVFCALPIVFIGFCITTACTTNSSISLEGKNLWILKSLPISVMEIFKSKIAVNLIVVVPISIVASILLNIGFKNSLIYYIWSIVIIVLMALIVSIGGLIINLLFPKLEWSSETVVVKQSMSASLGVLVGFLILIVSVGGYFVIPNIDMNIYLGIVSVVLAIINLLAYRYLATKGKNLFDKL